MLGLSRSGWLFTVFAGRKVEKGLAALGAAMLLALLGCSGGGSDSKSDGGSRPTIASFTANPSSVSSGASTTLSWSVTGATSLKIDPGNNDVTGYSSATASNLTQTTTFTLTASNTSGSSTATTTVTVNASVPTINSFTANPTTINRGQSSTLSWSVNNATTLSIDNGVGAVSGTSTTVSPQNTTSYTLTATNSSGNAISTATVTVSAPAADTATGAVSTNTSGTIITPLGAKITVPIYAVPPTHADGTGTGTMTFSLEKIAATTPTLPPGETVTTDVYRLGPEGFTLARPVTVTLPVSGDRLSNLVRLYRVDPTTNQATLIPSTYDAATHTVSGNALKFSPWFATFGSADTHADGAFMVSNLTSNYWLNLCVDQINSVTYPTQAPSVAGAWGGQATWAPMGTIGWNSSGKWFLVQGSYRICAELQTAGTLSTPPGPKVHWFLDNMVISGPSTYANGWQTSGAISVSGPGAGAVDGPCPCQPTFTPTVGTGDVQVTLSWAAPAPGIDLDLHIIEPSGTEIYYGNLLDGATGGQLDLDNKCSNYVDSKPENIFWPTGRALAGQYKVRVHCFRDCGTGRTSEAYTVRVINKGSVTTYSGTIPVNSNNAFQEVTVFTVN